MVAAAKKNMGKMPCPHCKDPVAVMQAPTGTLSYKCQHADCEATGFAAAHTAAARKWLAALGAPKDEPAEPAKTPKAAPDESAPAPAPSAPPAKAPRPAFSLDLLK